MEAPYSFHMEGKWSLCAARVINGNVINSMITLAVNLNLASQPSRHG